MSYAKPTFSVNDFDFEGDVVEKGIYLHFGDTRIKVADSGADFGAFIENLKVLRKEIQDNYRT